MEKKSFKGANQSSKHGEYQENSDESDDNSILAEKEESHSEIDTIEEEVDLSMSEGSDREEVQESGEAA
jgi:hypothetical protein